MNSNAPPPQRYVSNFEGSEHQTPASAPPNPTILKAGKVKTATGALRDPGYNAALKSLNTVPSFADLPDCEIGAVELLTFFPNHTQWPKVVLRLIGNGWTGEDMAKVIFWARGLNDKEEVEKRRNALRHQIPKAGKEEFGTNFNRTTFMPQITDPNRVGGCQTYHAEDYRPRSHDANRLYAPMLADLGAGVVNWPAPEDSGIVTRAIRWAIDFQLDADDVDDIEDYARELNFQMPADASGTQWDQRGRERVLAAMDAAGYW